MSSIGTCTMCGDPANNGAASWYVGYANGRVCAPCYEYTTFHADRCFVNIPNKIHMFTPGED